MFGEFNKKNLGQNLGKTHGGTHSGVYRVAPQLKRNMIGFCKVEYCKIQEK
jgi:hypothetical protein